MAHPIDGEGHSQTLHMNYLLPISHILKQEEHDHAVEGEGDFELTPVPHEKDASLLDQPMESQPEGTPQSPSKQC